MPIVIDTVATAANSRDPALPLAQRLTAIPGFHGAFDPAVLSAGAVSSWSATHGAGLLEQATAANRPTRGDLGGVPVVTHADGTDALWSNGTWPLTGARLTIGLRVWMADYTVDQQYAWGCHTTFRMIWRAGTWNWFLANTPAGNITVPIDPAQANGWHTIIVSQDDTGVTVEVDGASQWLPNAGGVPLFKAPVIGNCPTSATVTTGFGWRGSIGRVFLAQSGTHDTPHHRSVREWLEG